MSDKHKAVELPLDFGSPVLLARTSSAREHAAAQALKAEAELLDRQRAADSRELQAVRAEMKAVRAEMKVVHDHQIVELPDESLATICRFVGVCELGRLACVSRRFTKRTLAALGGEGDALQLSPIEEGARQQLVATGNGCRYWWRLATRHGQATWLRALWEATIGWTPPRVEAAIKADDFEAMGAMALSHGSIRAKLIDIRIGNSEYYEDPVPDYGGSVPGWTNIFKHFVFPASIKDELRIDENDLEDGNIPGEWLCIGVSDDPSIWAKCSAGASIADICKQECAMRCADVLDVAAQKDKDS